MKTLSPALKSDLIASLLGGAALAVLPAIFSPGLLARSWLAFAVLSIPAVFGLLRAWRWGGGGRALAIMIVLAFGLRLGLGMFLSAALPAWGHDEAAQNAGYVFQDAYMRDTQAWQLAVSGDSLLSAFTTEFASDQYGGLLSLMALLYRALSPDAQRPLLVVLVGAFFTAAGTAFFTKATQARWGRSVALAAGWIFVLYPDSVLLGASQMREPFLIGLTALAFWATLEWSRLGARRAAVILVAALVGMALFSSRVALPAAGVSVLWLWVEQAAPRLQGRYRALGWLGLVVAALVMLGLVWAWLSASSQWDLLLTERGSGRVQLALEELGDSFRVPFIIGYGLTQPVLPAAVADSTLPLWKVISIVRALGWYALAPLLLASLVMVWKVRPSRERNALLLVLGVSLVWILISSARAGGDQWDNPRYRTIFIVWLALLAGWAAVWAREHRDVWLWAFVVVELIFLRYFGEWYFSRYFHIGKRLPFPQMAVRIIGWSALALVAALAWDGTRAWRAKGKRNNKPQA